MRIDFGEIAEILRFTLDYLQIDTDDDAIVSPLIVAEVQSRRRLRAK